MKIGLAITSAVLVLAALPARAETPVELLGRQLTLINEKGVTALGGTFADGAPLVLPVEHATMASYARAFKQPELEEAKATKGKVTVGTRGELTWIVAEAVQRYTILADSGCGGASCLKKRTIRISELVRNGKAVAVHLDDPVRDEAPGAMTPIPGATKTSTLAGLLAKPAELANALLDDPNTIVLGTELKERAVGVKAAKKLLASWAKLQLAVTEVREDLAAGYVVANVTWTKPKGGTVPMRATMFVVPVDGGHKVAAVHYSIAYERPLWR